jgi:regulator of sigma E protease
MDTFLSILRVVGTLFEVVLLFNLLILVHELGHFWAARWRGLKVEKFQIWFGPTLWRKKINGVQWGLGSIPFGGFVALPQMAPMETLEGRTEAEGGRAALPPVTPLDKIIVAFAGPLFSFLFAVVCALVVWKVGRPVSSMESTVIVGGVVPDMPAAKGGILTGDEILEVDGHPVQGFGGLTDGIMARVAFSQGETVAVKVRRAGETAPLDFDLVPKIDRQRGFFQRSDIRQIGIVPAFPPVIGQIVKDGPAARAGLKPGDRFVSLNGSEVRHAGQVGDFVKANPAATVRLEVERGRERFSVALTPLTPLKPADLGPMLGVVWTDDIAIIHPGPLEQLHKAATTVFKTLAALFSPKSDISVKHLSSPVGIGGAYYDMLRSPHGWQLALWFSVVVNVNLAILNLLPLPILDGGHITLSLLEWIRGRAVNARFLEVVQTGFALLLIGFMFYVVILDVGDRAGGGGGAGSREEIVFPPPAGEPATP